jgi:HEPN domain-containing protein
MENRGWLPPEEFKRKKELERQLAMKDIAFAHIRASKLLLTNKKDTLVVNMAAYHLQQGVETWLKYRLAEINQPTPKIHDCTVLAYMLRDLGAPPPDWLINCAKTITSFAVNVRYRADIDVAPDMVEVLCNSALKLFVIT